MYGAIQELMKYIEDNRPNKDDLSRFKIKLAKKHKLQKVPSDIELLLNIPVEQVNKFRKYLTLKPVRNLSGITAVAVMTEPHSCPHGRCFICPGGLDSAFGDVPQSYTGHEPATRRACRNHYDPYLQVFNRLEQYIAAGHIPQKIELIIMGGTFPSLDINYQDLFIYHCFKAMNDFSAMFFRTGNVNYKNFRQFFELPGNIHDKNRERSIQRKTLFLKGPAHNKTDREQSAHLLTEQKRNETSHVRCVGLTIETRSDYAKEKHIQQMLKLGCTRIELGVQSVYDDDLKFINRGHTVQDNIKAIKLLKNHGFKINVHYMPGISVRKDGKVNLDRTLKGMKELFDNPDYRPDMLKIYPCMVIRGTKLFELYQKGKYTPLSTRQAATLIARFKPHIPVYCRVMRVQRDIPSDKIEAGVDRTNLRQYIKDIMDKENTRCMCIRCNEIAHQKADHLEMDVLQYDASGGNEYFIYSHTPVHNDKEHDNQNIAGYCRLRISDNKAFIRELHVYGPSVPINNQNHNSSVQHTGIGKKLLAAAQKIVIENKISKVHVISGVGVRPYYRKLGYRKENTYMIKRF